jgi:hypothetical protein
MASGPPAPPSAAVRHRAMASSTLTCFQRIHRPLRSMRRLLLRGRDRQLRELADSSTGLQHQLAEAGHGKLPVTHTLGSHAAFIEQTWTRGRAMTFSTNTRAQISCLYEEVLHCLLRLQKDSAKARPGIINEWPGGLDYSAVAVETGRPLTESDLTANGISLTSTFLGCREQRPEAMLKRFVKVGPHDTYAPRVATVGGSVQSFSHIC